MTISQPDITFNIIPAASTISNAPQKVLFIGQMLSGTATAGSLVTNIGNSGEETALFGAKSMIAQMVRQARRINKVTQFDAIPLADAGAGTAATGTIAFSGTATANGTLVISLGSGANYAVSLPIAIDDTATEVGDAFVALVNALTTAPFTAANSTGTVTITSSHKGEFGNNVGYKVEGAVAGITVALTLPTNGATNPTLTNIFDVIDGERYQTIVWPETYTLSTLTTELDTRFNVSNDILDGVGIQTLSNTYSNLVSAGNAQNSKSLVLIGNKKLAATAHKGGALLEFSDVISAQFAALRSLRLTEGANISQYVISPNGALDTIGGPAISALPYFNSPFPLLDLIDVGVGFSKTEIEGLITAGVSTLANNKTRTSIISGEIVTTRKTDSAGNAETTFKFLNAVDTSTAVREFYFNNLKARFAQSRLTQGDLIPNRNMANQAVIESYLDNLFQQLGGDNYVLVQSGATAQKFFKNNRTVTLSLIDGSVTITMQAPIVTQLRTIIATMQISFSTEG
jgi:phage tail sheath gpL-like